MIPMEIGRVGCQRKQGEIMTIRKAGKGIVKKAYGRPTTYRIGFRTNDGEEDETELDAIDMKELDALWKSLREEFNCRSDSVLYVEVA